MKEGTGYVTNNMEQNGLFYVSIENETTCIMILIAMNARMNRLGGNMMMWTIPKTKKKSHTKECMISNNKKQKFINSVNQV